MKEYAPNSVLGINCHAGEHLNFLFKKELDVEAGDTIVVRVTEEPSKVFLIGSWNIPCEFLEFSEIAEETNDNTQNETTPSINSENKVTTSTEITLTMGMEDFKGMNYNVAEQKFREMGFANFQYKIVNTEDKTIADTISYCVITEFIFGNSSFVEGDKFDADSTVTLYYYKYEEPATPRPEFYSTNDRENAKKGNTGVFSYKNKKGTYDIYWIIDFDEGCIYNFADGNGDTHCDKVKIVSGDLNDRITVTWHDGGDQWTWYLHFKYKNSPDTLVVNDHNGFAAEFTTTDLEDALSVRNTKTIMNY